MVVFRLFEKLRYSNELRKINYILESLLRIDAFGGGKWQNGSSPNITQNRLVGKDWVDRPQNLQLLQGSHLDNFPLKTLKLGRVAFHSLTFQF